MTEWLINLPIISMALVVFLGTFLVATAVYLIVMRLAVNDDLRAFKGLSPDATSTRHSFRPARRFHGGSGLD